MPRMGDRLTFVGGDGASAFELGQPGQVALANVTGRPARIASGT